MIASKAQKWNQIFFWNSVPNTITTIRLLILFPMLYFLYIDGSFLKVIAIASLIIMLFMDKLDGYLARKLNQATKFGSIFDIAGDRIIEITFWMVFADLKLIPVWVPVVILTRGILTDSIRYYALSKDKTPFGKESMMKSRLTEFIVGSDFMRAIANVKILAFILLILTTMYPQLLGLSLILTYVSVFVNLLRGIPVIIDANA
jgi:CDP-diacylglycerol--glycerol-3-phosphate 3-phosphatidyltransferase